MDAVVQYVTEDGVYITNLTDEELSSALARAAEFKSRKELLVRGAYAVARDKVRETGNWRDGIEVLETQKGSSRDLAIHGERITSYLRSLGKPQTSASTVWELDSFGELPKWKYWKKSLLLLGPSGVGKTSLGKSLIQEMTGYPHCLIRHLDRLKTYSPAEHGGILFDEIDYGVSRPFREFHIQLTDLEDEQQLHIRYGVAVIAPGTPKIFTSNRGTIPGTKITEALYVNDPAVFRRIQIWRVDYDKEKDCFIINKDRTQYPDEYRPIGT